MSLPVDRSAGETFICCKTTGSRSGSCCEIINSTSYLEELKDSFWTLTLGGILQAQKVFASSNKRRLLLRNWKIWGGTGGTQCQICSSCVCVRERGIEVKGESVLKLTADLKYSIIKRKGTWHYLGILKLSLIFLTMSLSHHSEILVKQWYINWEQNSLLSLSAFLSQTNGQR